MKPSDLAEAVRLMTAATVNQGGEMNMETHAEILFQVADMIDALETYPASVAHFVDKMKAVKGGKS